MKRRLKYLLFIAIVATASQASAAKYTIDRKEDSVIGALTTTFSHEKDTLLDIARANGLGYQDIKLVNPGVDTWLPGAGEVINLPLQFVLPNGPRKGIVLNIPEMRLYYYPEKKKGENSEPTEIITYPLGVGREGWSTPYMKTKIIEKKEKPNWHPPKSILKEHEEAGDPLPKIVKAGPDNPLGDYAMRLGKPDYLIHGTNKPFGIGMRVSHGCIRLYPEDIEQLFSNVKVGTRVEIVNQPFKVGEKEGVLYLEAHPFLEEDAEVFKGLAPVVELVAAVTKDDNFEINWDMVRKTARNPAGVPVPIGKRIENNSIDDVEDVEIENSIAAAEPKQLEMIAEPVELTESAKSAEPAEIKEPIVQVAEITDDADISSVESDKNDVVEPAQNVVIPRKTLLRKRAVKKQESKLRLRMDTEINP